MVVHSLLLFPAMDSVLLQMKDMPSNPEDGELFLPPFIVEEINSGVFHPKKKNQLCYAAIVAGYGGLKAGPTNSANKPFAHIPANNQVCEKKAEQAVAIEQKLTWAQVLKKEAESPKNMCVPPQSTSSISFRQAKSVKGKGAPNKQVIHPNSAKKSSGKKKK